MQYWTEEKLEQKVRQMRERQKRKPALTLGKIAEDFFKRKVNKRHKQLQKITHAWGELLPQELQEHSCIEAINRGVLKVLVDSQEHYAELAMLVRCGLADQIIELEPTLAAFSIKLIRGRWYHVDEEGNQIADW